MFFKNSIRRTGRRNSVHTAHCQAHTVQGTRQTPGSGGRQWSGVPSLPQQQLAIVSVGKLLNFHEAPFPSYSEVIKQHRFWKKQMAECDLEPVIWGGGSVSVSLL